jgi:hypothetical protein
LPGDGLAVYKRVEPRIGIVEDDEIRRTQL